MRACSIWVTGVLSCAVAGGYLAMSLAGQDAGGPGAVAGALGFTCARLWVGEVRAG